MKRLIIILSITIVAIAAVLLIYKPDIIKDIWLWVVGLIGVIVGYSQSLLQKIKGWVGPDEEAKEKQTASVPAADSVNENKPELSLLRYFDDGDLTFGMLYYKDEFFCYTLEETRTESDSSIAPRISEGEYPVGFDLRDTPMTATYRQKFPWFKYHLQLKKTGTDSQEVYIHSGGTDSKTVEGIILLNSLITSDIDVVLKESEQVYQNLYQELYTRINEGEPIHIHIYNENWFHDRFYKLLRP